MTVAWAKLNCVVTRVQNDVPVHLDETYQTVGILNRGRGLFRRPPISGAETNYPRFYRISADQLVYSKLFAWEGAIAVVSDEFDGACVSPEFPTFELRHDRVLPEYLSHVVGWAGFTERLAAATTGLGQRRQRVNVDDLVQIEVPLPEIDEQRRIAAHLDGIDRVRRSAVAASNNSSAVSHALIEHAIQRLARAPLRPLGEIVGRERIWFEPENGKRYAPIGVRGFGRGLIRYPEISRDELPKLRFYPVNPERMIVSNIKAWEGAVALTTADDSRRIASNRFLQYRLTSDEATLPYLHRYLISSGGLAQLQAASPGSADRNRTLSMEGFEAIRVPLPDIGLQGELLQLIDKLAEIGKVGMRRRSIADALLPAARNEIFSAMR